MADHGKNRRRSLHARRRQRQGKMKKAMEFKQRTLHRKKLHEFWKTKQTR